MASDSRRWRTAPVELFGGSWLIEDADQPRDAPRDEGAVRPVGQECLYACKRLGRVVRLGDARSPRTISATGQNVMPSPYGRHCPRRTRARPLTRLRELVTRRDLPTPAGPTMVRGARRAVLRRPGRGSERRSVELGLAADHGGVDRRASASTRSCDLGDRRVRRDGLGLALQRQRVDRRDVDASWTSGRCVTRSGPRLGRGLLEPRGDVDGVARDQRWPAAGSPATTSPVLTPVRFERPHAPMLVELVVELGERRRASRRRRGPRAARRPRAASAGRRQP